MTDEDYTKTKGPAPHSPDYSAVLPPVPGDVERGPRY
jgi:hypothetical protein